VAQNTPSNLINDITAKNTYFGDSFKMSWLTNNKEIKKD
jgi:hypothetical protein